MLRTRVLGRVLASAALVVALGAAPALSGAGAVAKATGCVSLDSLVGVAENKNAVKQGYAKVTVLSVG